MSKGKRLGWFAMCLVVFLASFAVQIVAAVVMVLPVTFMAGFQAGMQGITDMETINQMSTEAVNGIMPATILVTHLLLLVTFLLWYRFGCGKPSFKKVDWKDVLQPKHVLAMVLIAIGMNFVANYGLGLVYPIIPESIVENYESLMESAGFGDSLLPTIAAVLIAPFGEELIFRGVTLHYAKKAVADLSNRKLAFWIANVLQAVLFGVFHMNIIQGTYAFILGMVLGYLAYRFKSILPAILGHMLFNGFSTFFAEPIAEMVPETNLAYAVVTIVAVAVMLAGRFLAGPATKLEVSESRAEIA